MKTILKYALYVILTVFVTSSLAQGPVSTVREEHAIVVDGVMEQWRLEWIGETKPVCAPEDESWSTCPCNGFAFGESGNLVLVRKRMGPDKDERLELNRFFLETPSETGKAVLRRWDPDEKDIKETDTSGFAARVSTRPISTVIHFADYDHDGRATEFLLQVGTLPCGKKMSVAVGISRRNGRLHVFTTAEHPDRPLILQTSQWEALRNAAAPIKVLDWKCGDHGSDAETELELSADANGIHVTKNEYECDKDSNRGKLIRSKVRYGDEGVKK